MESLFSYAFMLFGLGFFIFCIRVVRRDHREAWEQRMMEAREFGLGRIDASKQTKHPKE